MYCKLFLLYHRGYALKMEVLVSQYENNETTSGKGKFFLAGLVILVAMIALSVLQDKETLVLASSPDQGVLLAGWEKVPFTENRNLWAAAYSMDGKRLWTRKYKVALPGSQWTMPLVVETNSGWTVQTGPLQLVLDSNGKEQERLEDPVLTTEEIPVQENPEQENTVEEGYPQSLVLGKLEYSLVEKNGKEMLQCNKPSAELWSLNLEKHMSFAGNEVEILGLGEDLDGNIVVLIQESGRSTPQHVGVTRSGEIMKYSLSDDFTMLKNTTAPTSDPLEDLRDYSSSDNTFYSPVELELENGSMSYRMRKGNLIGVNRETMESWEHRQFLPILAVMEDYF